jgi:hypothetical protein
MRRLVIPSICTAAASLLLAACGGGSSSDKDQITQIIKSYGATPTKLCTQYASAQMIRHQFLTKANCLRAASNPAAKDPYLKVNGVTVRGSTATAIRTSGSNPGKGTKATIVLHKTSSGWKIDAVVPKS